MLLNKWQDFILFNFLAKDKENAEQVMEAGKGFVIPGIVAADYENVSDGARKIEELKTVTNIISIGLGGSGNPVFSTRVVEIAARSNPGHINQPFENTTYAKGYLEAKGVPQIVNALVKPSGKPGTICLDSGHEIKVEEFVEIAKATGIESIKFMPLKGETHLDELVYLTKIAAEKGIRGIEPAGGISSTNIKQIIHAVKEIGIEFFMPHIFGTTIDTKTGRTLPNEIVKIIKALEG